MKNVLLIGMLLLICIGSKGQTVDTTIYQNFVWSANYFSAAADKLEDVARLKKEKILYSIGTSGATLLFIGAVSTQNLPLIVATGILTGAGVIVIIHHVILEIIRTKQAGELIRLASRELVKPKTAQQNAP